MKKPYDLCLICNKKFDDSKSFGYHLQFSHKVKVEDYIVKYFFNGEKPKCFHFNCEEHTRYVRGSYSYKKYCKAHAKEAMKEGGSKGGKAETWNK
jgi:hypothetical protein